MLAPQPLSLTSHAKIAELEYEHGIGNFEVTSNHSDYIIFNGEKYRTKRFVAHDYHGYNDPKHKYIELRTAELKADQTLIREYCYA
jgi:hypothetical protein